MIGMAERLGVEGEGEKRAFDNFSMNLRVASPGIIESFDSDAQTVTVKVAIRERIVCNHPSFIAKHGANVGNEEIGLLLDVPIVVPRAGGYAITFPIQIGDECLVIFSDTCIDAWFQSGGIQNQMSLRRHDLSDGFAIIGPWSQPRILPGYSTDSVQMRSDDGVNYVEISSSEMNLVFGATRIKLDASGIRCTGNVLMDNNLQVTGATTLNGLNTLNGITSINNTTTIQDKNFLNHTHKDTQPGAGSSGVVS